MKYNIVCESKAGNRHERSITLIEFENLMADIEHLQRFMMLRPYYDIVKDNLLELNHELSNINVVDQKQFRDMNRYVYNAVNTFYAFIEYNENNFKEIFSHIKTKYYDKYFEYRFMYNLRIYMTHCEMAITSIKFNPLKPGVQPKVYVSRDNMVKKGKVKKEKSKKSKLQKKFIEDLERINKTEIEILPITRRFVDIYKDLHLEMMETIKVEMEAIINKIDTGYLEYEGEDKEAKTCYIFNSEDKKIELMLSSFLSIFIKEIKREY